jgi:UrcA family protein
MGNWTAAAAALSMVLLSGSALAGGSDDLPRAHVSYADLNIHNQAGVEELFRRIRVAANSVCNGQGVDSRQLSEVARYRACIAQAMDGAVAEAHLPMLTAYYRAKRTSNG